MGGAGITRAHQWTGGGKRIAPLDHAWSNEGGNGEDHIRSTRWYPAGRRRRTWHDSHGSRQKNLISGIEAECGGACACATCHVYIDAGWREKVGKPAEMEEDMLDFAFDVREESRLSCQIKITAALDGLIIRVPDKQF